MVASAGTFQSFGFGRVAQSANTAIKRLIPGRPNRKSKITELAFSCGVTAHTLTAMLEQGRTTVKGAVASGASSLKLAADPGAWGSAKRTAANPIEASDNVVILMADGTELLDTVNTAVLNADGTVTITLVTNSTMPCAINDGALFWFIGASGDTDPHTGLAFESFLGTANAQAKLGTDFQANISTYQQYSPIVLYDNNATNAGSIDFVNGVYAP